MSVQKKALYWCRLEAQDCFRFHKWNFLERSARFVNPTLPAGEVLFIHVNQTGSYVSAAIWICRFVYFPCVNELCRLVDLGVDIKVPRMHLGFWPEYKNDALIFIEPLSVWTQYAGSCRHGICRLVSTGICRHEATQVWKWLCMNLREETD